jgi:hypothetical protein
MKKTVLILAVVVVAVLAWFFWALGRNTGALEEAARHLEDGDAPAAIEALERMTSFPLDDHFGHLQRAARLRLFANRLGHLRELSPGDLLDFEVKIVALRDRFPRTLFAVSAEVARRLARAVPDPIHVNAERLVVLWDGHPVTRLTIGGEVLARRGPHRFGAGNLGDDPDPREVLLEDPEGFRGTTRAVVRVDVKAPAVTTVRAPVEVESAAQFRVECDADEPVVRVVQVTVRGARLLGAGGRGQTGWIRALGGRVPGADDVGLMTWSFRVEDAVGNRSAAVEGQATGVPAAWLERARTLGTATRAEMLEMEGWTRRHWKFLPETRRTVASEAERRLRALIPATLSLDSTRTLRLPNDHPVTTLEIDGRACARGADGSFVAAGIPDATAPRRVVLVDPHGFRASTRATIRIRP